LKTKCSREIRKKKDDVKIYSVKSFTISFHWTLLAGFSDYERLDMTRGTHSRQGEMAEMNKTVIRKPAHLRDLCVDIGGQYYTGPSVTETR
jgi:hypothetical protein